jgi:dipeptidyl-peptidase 4
MKKMRPAFATALTLLIGGLGSACSHEQQPTQRPTQPTPARAGVAVRSQNEDFLRQYAATLRFSLGRPRTFTVAPDGGSVLFLRSGPRSFVQDLYEFDCAAGKERVLLTAQQVLGGAEEHLTPDERARRERMRLATRGIAGYELSEDGTKLLVPLSGRLFVIDRKSGESKELESKGGAALDPRLSPYGSLVACVRDGEVYVTDIESGAERKLTTGAGATITNGLPEFVAQEEMDRFEGYWWSPDARRIAYQQTDTAGMEVFRIADPVHPESAANEWPYPRPGKKNAGVKLGIVATSGADTTWVNWDAGAYPYLATVKWAKNSPLTILVQNRTQTEEVLYAVDDKTGETRELLREKDPAWINLQQSCPMWLKDGSGFLWMTERTGEWTLELHDPEGSLVKVLTPRGLGLEGLVGLDSDARVAFVSASGDAAQSHVCMVPLSGTQLPMGLTDTPGAHKGDFAKGDAPASVWVHSYDLADGGKAVRVERVPESGAVADGATAKPVAIGELKSLAEEPPFMPSAQLRTVGEHKLRALVIRPRAFDPSKKYPVIDSVYGGPHAITVNATPRAYVLNQWLADQGFIVVSIDGRGTPRRGRDWERSIKNNVIDGPLDDQVEGLRELGKLFPEMDMDRVGITGWSFGGYFSAIAAMRRPDVFKAGVSGAPVVDWRDYDTHYTERYMGLPEDNKPGYDRCSVLTYCKDLRVPLLDIHGTADDNVYFMHSLKMTEALFRAGKTFEFLPLAGFTHMVPDPEVTVKLQGRVVTFFKKNLGDPR